MGERDLGMCASTKEMSIYTLSAIMITVPVITIIIIISANGKWTANIRLIMSKCAAVMCPTRLPPSEVGFTVKC